MTRRLPLIWLDFLLLGVLGIMVGALLVGMMFTFGVLI
jgi:hypothetical protein